MKFKSGDRVRYIHSDNMKYVDQYRDENGNPGEAVLDSGLSGRMVTGKKTGTFVMFREDEIELVSSTAMRILHLKRSTHKTGLKVYGKVQGESGKVYNVAYFRRPAFRGWICSCENFFFTMFAKKRNCKHLRFVRKEVGRFAASVK